MKLSNFIHLRVHSAYSLSEGAIKVEDLVSLCKDYSMPAVALTDSGNLFGALEFSLTASKAGIQPIIGCQMLVNRPNDCGGEALYKTSLEENGYDTLVLLVQTQEGYRNLIKLVSKSFLDTPPEEQPHIQFSDLTGYTDGLIALTGGPSGALGKLLADGQNEFSVLMLRHLKSLFSGRLYIELMRHGTINEEKIESSLIKLAFEHDIPLVATNDCFFSDESMYEAHDALMCIAERKHIDDPNRRRLTRLHGFRSESEMKEIFSDIPEAIDNTVVIAKRCAFAPQEHSPMLPAFPTTGAKSEADQLRQASHDGLEKRLNTLGIKGQEILPYKTRIDFELEVINDMGFPGYFLIVADFIQWAKSQNIPVGPGRGSGAGSVVAWALTITDLDPLKFGLLFERFLNPERVSMPDFDIDFCQDRRDEVINYVKEKYGPDRVAQIITFGKLQAKAVLRDVGRVLGMPYSYVDRICKLIPFNPAHPPSLEDALKIEPELVTLRDGDEQVSRLFDIGLKLEGLYRHASTHAAGLVIGDQRLDEFVPLYQDPRSDMAATQFSMKYAEAAGLVKFDFLGLKTLTVLDKTINLIKESGFDVNLDSIPLNDTRTYEMLGAGDTVGVFQLESTGMRDVLKQMKPDCFEDIIALVALYRPGPMDNIPRYIACKHGQEKPDYLHPELKEILKETFGVIIYQEQVMEIAKVLSGYSLGNADLLRRAMGKKIKKEMEAQRNVFVEGAKERGVDSEKAAQIFDQVNKFADYGFNKSHAAAYAVVAYQTAWLKANYPVEFIAASMTLDMGNTEKLNVYRQELARLSIDLIPPDINESHSSFAVRKPKSVGEKGAVLYALSAVKNVGDKAMESLVKERTLGGPFANVMDFAKRLNGKVVNKRLIENLITAGAFDSLEMNRKKLFNSIDIITKMTLASDRERENNQENLFSEEALTTDVEKQNFKDVNDWPKLERLGKEFESVGFYLSDHPLDVYGDTLSRLGVQSYASLGINSAGTRPKLAGVIDSIRERTSSKGNKFAFVRFSGKDGMFEVVVFSDVLSTSRELIQPGKAVLITCEVRAEGDDLKLSCLNLQCLEKAAENVSGGLKIFLNEPGSLESLKSAIEKGKSGKGKIYFVLSITTDQSVEMTLPKGYTITPDMKSEIEAVPGVSELRDL